MRYQSLVHLFLQHEVVSIKVNLYALRQGVIDMNRNGNFCKGTRVSKIVAKAKVDACVEQ